MNGYDSASFTPQQSGAGGSAALGLGEIGGGRTNAAGPVGPNQVISAPGTRGFSLPPVVFMFLFLIVGYWGLHQCLKVV